MTSIDLFLIGVSFFTSMLTAVIGVGGGVFLMMIMLLFYPPLTVIPVHGVVQMGSNAGRAYILRRYIHWMFLLSFAVGAVIGSLVGSQFVFNISQTTLEVTLAILALIFTWLPKFKTRFKFPFQTPILGSVVSFMGMFGAGAGLILGSFIARLHLPKKQAIATQGACIFMVHTMKVVAFGLFGFAFSEYWQLMVFMVISGFAGTFVGTRILDKVDNALFMLLFKGAISILCLRLIFINML